MSVSKKRTAENQKKLHELVDELVSSEDIYMRQKTKFLSRFSDAKKYAK